MTYSHFTASLMLSNTFRWNGNGKASLLESTSFRLHNTREFRKGLNYAKRRCDRGFYRDRLGHHKSFGRARNTRVWERPQAAGCRAALQRVWRTLRPAVV